ncbi:dihydrofolate reductase [Ancylobacter sp. 6x-1]|uniref:Dihydrofolate reductase n=1 Tax=Ancylobacter crimeensis TaxID=2579147 RepID=A0ABT0DEF1_9HYPH|nr:dihydrofolate reductase [Ancylobacter crimeensis]MCK0198318.1 dihydrofolate reductase [Ancylobacter crimeensis]
MSGRTRLRLVIVVAVAENGVIGRGDALPWHVSGDLKRFRAITWGKPIVMGRRTFESIGRPLPGRTSIVVSRDAGLNLPDGVLKAATLDEAMRLAGAEAERLGVDEAALVGGAMLYAAALPRADALRLTRIHASPEGDVTFPPFDAADWREVHREGPLQGEKDDHAFSFIDYERA